MMDQYLRVQIDKATRDLMRQQEQEFLYQRQMMQVPMGFDPAADWERRCRELERQLDALQRKSDQERGMVDKTIKSNLVAAEQRCKLFENVALCAMRYSKAQSARYKRELDEAIEQLDRVHALKPGL